MLFTILCCVSTGLTIYCILKRVNQQTVKLAVHAAVHEARREFHEREGVMIAQLAAKERELAKARGLVKLHETVPTMAAPAARAARAATKTKRDGLEMFEMSRPFTDTSYDALMAGADVVKVEPAAI